jgi:hypothetical protein
LNFKASWLLDIFADHKHISFTLLVTDDVSKPTAEELLCFSKMVSLIVNKDLGCPRASECTTFVSAIQFKPAS